MKALPLLLSSSKTSPGLKRTNNEDCYLSLPEHHLWMIADGMGGHEAGEVASAIVKKTLQKLYQRPLTGAIQTAHKSILHAVNKGLGASGMGSTVVALHCQNDCYEIAWVGDSRAYSWSNTEELVQISTDHSYVQMLVESGAISAKEAETHPEKNIITQCLGSQELEEVQVDSITQPWLDTRWIILCSDGLSDELDHDSISTVLKLSTTPEEANTLLMRAALKHGGRDNITIQIIAAPVQHHSLLSNVSEFVPQFTANRRWDTVIYVIACCVLVSLLYWIVS